MASTYSTNLKIELIGTGDQSGTWGNTTNTNLGTLIEEAIAGYVTQTVTDGAATVLTIPNGASSNGRNYVIELTGALTAARTVEVPAVDKPYTFFNNTSGGYAVTVKVSGQTGVTIANGKKAIVYTNSTDVIEVANAPVTEAGTQTLTNKTLTNPTINGFTGNTSVVNIGSGQIYKDSSGNVGIGTSSPGERLSLAGATNVYASILTTGGIKSQLFSSDSTGGGGVGTTTNHFMALYTNNTERMRIDSSGKVSIGKTSALVNLDVLDQVMARPSATTGSGEFIAAASDYLSGPSFTNTAIRQYGSTATGTLYGVSKAGMGLLDFINGTSAVIGSNASVPIIFANQSTERMRIDSSGNVGVGTSSPSAKLDVNGQRIRVGNVSDPGLELSNGTTTKGYVFYDTTNDVVTVRHASTGTGVSVNSSGNVGIGTNSPLSAAGYKFTTLGAGTSGGGFNINNSSGTEVSRYFTDNAQIGLWAGSGLPITFSTLGSSERARIDSSGNVGIGTASPPEKLSVNGNMYFTNTTPILYGPGNLSFQCGANSTTIFNYNAGPEAMRITTVGDLCIGTTGAFLSNTSSFAFSTYYQYSIFNKPSTSASGSYYIYFGYNGGAIGSVTQNGTTGVLFNTASDYRLKEHVQPMKTGLATITALNPVTYNWISDKSHGEGFIAHELQAIIPGAVTGEKDAVDKDGKIKPQGVDYSKIVVHLVAAIQELSAKVAALEAK
jgi:hypothetical protein